MVAMTFRRVAPSARARRYFRSVSPNPRSSRRSRAHAFRRWWRERVRLPLRTTDAAAGLQKPQGETGSSPRTLGDQGRQRLVRLPLQRLGSVRDDLGQLLDGVELETEQEPHPVPERLEKAELVGRAEKKRELGKGKGSGTSCRR